MPSMPEQVPTMTQASRSSAWRAYFLLSLASLAWAGNAVISRVAIGEVSPMLLTCARWLIVSVIFVVMRGGRLGDDARLLLPHWRTGLWMGAIGYTLFSAIIYVAAYYTQAVNLAILQGTIPVFVLLGALVLHGTRVGPLQVLGVALTLIGVIVVASKGDVHILMALAFNVGDLLMLVGCAAYALYALQLRDRPPIPAILFFMLMAAGAFVASLPLLVAEMLLGQTHWPTTNGLWVIAFVALAPSFIAQLSFMKGVELIGPGRAGVFVNFVPIFGAFLSVAILSEPFGVYHALALALVLSGIFLAERRTK
jgi:drug/metabolite transporter (DMT)-like permease